MKNRPSVTVVVPTVGRATLGRALDSVRAQSYEGPIELVVVGPESALADLDVTPDTRTVATAGRVNGARARNLGLAAAHGDLVAFLDDDDRWGAEKLRIQVTRAEALRQAGLLPVISCRHRMIDERDPGRSRVVPRTIYDGGDVARYLFRRRSPSGSRASIYTSSILADREVCERVPWSEHLSRHQDWDWLVRAGRLPNVAIVQDPRPLADIFTGTGASVSASVDWEASLRWADDELVRDPETYVDFLCAQTLRYALSAGSGAGVAAVARRVRSAPARPSASNMVIAAAGLIPRRTLERLLFTAMPWNH